MPPDFNDGPPPFTVAMHVTVRFVQQVTVAENMDAATQMVRRKVELFVNKARAESERAGIEMRCEYLVAY